MFVEMKIVLRLAPALTATLQFFYVYVSKKFLGIKKDVQTIHSPVRNHRQPDKCQVQSAGI